MDSTLSRLVLSDELSYRIARHTLFWLACILFFGTIYGSFWHYGENSLMINQHTMIVAILFLPAHMFLGYSIIYFLFPKYLMRGKYIQLLIGVLLLILFTAVLSNLLSVFVVNPYRASQGLPVFPVALPSSLMAGLRGSNTVAGFVVAIKLVKYWYFKKVEIEHLEKSRLKTELELLHGQLQPHFLFNTLNNLYALVIRKSEDAPKVVLTLSELLHYMLTESRGSRISIHKELDMLEHYIALEQIRFGNRLDLRVDIRRPETERFIAPLLLLPFVENAFKHGVNEMLEQPWISLDIAVVKDQLVVKLINGKPDHVNGFRRPSTGIGLANVRKRLSLIYGNRSDLKTHDQGESYVVNLTLQLESA